MAAVRTLQQLVNDRLRALGDRNGPLSPREAARRANKKVSYETLRLISVGLHSGEITDRVAQGIALALQVDVAQVYAAAGVRPALGRFSLPPRFDRLNLTEREVIVSVGDAILTASTAARAEGPGLRAVARKRGER